MLEKLKELRQKLSDKHQEYMLQDEEAPRTAEYYLHLGKCAGIDESLTLIEELITEEEK